MLSRLYRLVFAFCILFIGQQVNAQIITIVDSETQEPLADVSLISYHPYKFTVTNAEGQASIHPFEGIDQIQIMRVGYKRMLFSYEELSANDSTVQLVPFAFSGDAVIVSANKWKQNAGDIPTRTTSISPVEMTLQNPQTAADLLGTSGEVFIQKSQLGGGSPMIRGFSTNRLLYTVDGVRMNTAIFRGGNLQNVISLDPFAIERTEVLYGPGSVMYGSDAIGAVMSFKTLNPQFSLNDKTLVSGNALFRYASASNERTAHIDINIGWKKWALVTSFTSYDFDHLKMGSNGPDEYLRPFYVRRQDSMDVIVTNEDPRIQRPSGYSQMNLMQKVRFKPNEKWDFEYGFHYSETSDYARYDRHIRLKNGLPRYGEWSYGPQVWMMNNLSITHEEVNTVYDAMNIRLAQQSFEESRISRDFNDDLRETRIENVEAYSANLDFSKSVGKRHNLFYGAEFVYNDVTSKGINEDISTGSISNGPSRYPNSNWMSVGGYLTDQFKVNDKLTFQAGARYNQYILNASFDTTFYPLNFTEAQLNNGALTGSLGMIYRPWDKWTFTVNASTGFRSPNVDDVGKVFDSEPGSVVVPNPDLQAEYAYNGEVGITKVFGDVMKVDVSAYYTVLQNALVRRDYSLNGMDSIMYDGELSQVQAIQNAAFATVYGIQAGIEIDLVEGLGFTSRFNYQIGEEELDDGTISPSRHAAPWFGTTRLYYHHKDLKIELNSQYSGAKTFTQLPIGEQNKEFLYAIDTNGNPYSPAWYTLNLKLMYQFTDHLTLSGGVENITDQRYRPYSSGIVAAGRNFIISLKASL